MEKASIENRHFFARIELFQRLVAHREAQGLAHEEAFAFAERFVAIACILRPYWIAGVRVPSVIRSA